MDGWEGKGNFRKHLPLLSKEKFFEWKELKPKRRNITKPDPEGLRQQPWFPKHRLSSSKLRGVQTDPADWPSCIWGQMLSWRLCLTQDRPHRAATQIFKINLFIWMRKWDRLWWLGLVQNKTKTLDCHPGLLCRWWGTNYSGALPLHSQEHSWGARSEDEHPRVNLACPCGMLPLQLSA